jgi:hypothetical protein
MSGVLRYVSRTVEGAATGAAKAVGVSGVDNRMPGEKHALLRVNGKTVLANFMGPGTKLKERLQRGDEPVSDIDKISLAHDLRYMLAKTPAEIQEADRLFLARARISDDNAYNKGLGLSAIGAKYAAEKLAGVKYPTQAELDANDPNDELLAPRMGVLVQQGYGASDREEFLAPVSSGTIQKKKTKEVGRAAALTDTLSREQLLQATDSLLYPSRPLTQEEIQLWKRYFVQPDAGNPRSSTSYETALNPPPDDAMYETQMDMGKPVEGDRLGLELPDYRNSLIRDENELTNVQQTEDSFTMWHPLELDPIRRGYATDLLPYSLVRPTTSARWNAPAIHDMGSLKKADKKKQEDTIKKHDDAMGKIHDKLAALGEERDKLLSEAADIQEDSGGVELKGPQKLRLLKINQRLAKIKGEEDSLNRQRTSGVYAGSQLSAARLGGQGVKITGGNVNTVDVTIDQKMRPQPPPPPPPPKDDEEEGGAGGEEGAEDGGEEDGGEEDGGEEDGGKGDEDDGKINPAIAAQFTEVDYMLYVTMVIDPEMKRFKTLEAAAEEAKKIKAEVEKNSAQGKAYYRWIFKRKTALGEFLERKVEGEPFKEPGVDPVLPTDPTPKPGPEPGPVPGPVPGPEKKTEEKAVFMPQKTPSLGNATYLKFGVDPIEGFALETTVGALTNDDFEWLAHDLNADAETTMEEIGIAMLEKIDALEAHPLALLQSVLGKREETKKWRSIFTKADFADYYDSASRSKEEVDRIADKAYGKYQFSFPFDEKMAALLNDIKALKGTNILTAGGTDEKEKQEDTPSSAGAPQGAISLNTNVDLDGVPINRSDFSINYLDLSRASDLDDLADEAPDFGSPVGSPVGWSLKTPTSVRKVRTPLPTELTVPLATLNTQVAEAEGEENGGGVGPSAVSRQGLEETDSKRVFEKIEDVTDSDLVSLSPSELVDLWEMVIAEDNDMIQAWFDLSPTEQNTFVTTNDFLRDSEGKRWDNASIIRALENARPNRPAVRPAEADQVVDLVPDSEVAPANVLADPEGLVRRLTPQVVVVDPTPEASTRAKKMAEEMNQVLGAQTDSKKTMKWTQPTMAVLNRLKDDDARLDRLTSVYDRLVILSKDAKTGDKRFKKETEADLENSNSLFRGLLLALASSAQPIPYPRPNMTKEEKTEFVRKEIEKVMSTREQTGELQKRSAYAAINREDPRVRADLEAKIRENENKFKTKLRDLSIEARNLALTAEDLVEEKVTLPMSSSSRVRITAAERENIHHLYPEEFVAYVLDPSTRIKFELDAEGTIFHPNGKVMGVNGNQGVPAGKLHQVLLTTPGTRKQTIAQLPELAVDLVTEQNIPPPPGRRTILSPDQRPLSPPPAPKKFVSSTAPTKTTEPKSAVPRKTVPKKEAIMTGWNPNARRRSRPTISKAPTAGKTTRRRASFSDFPSREIPKSILALYPTRPDDSSATVTPTRIPIVPRTAAGSNLSPETLAKIPQYAALIPTSVERKKRRRERPFALLGDVTVFEIAEDYPVDMIGKIQQNRASKIPQVRDVDGKVYRFVGDKLIKYGRDGREFPVPTMYVHYDTIKNLLLTPGVSRGLPKQRGTGVSHQSGYDVGHLNRKRPLVDLYQYEDCTHHVSDGFSFGQHLTKFARHN